MVKIRLKRLGAKKRPYYRLVVADARSPRDGRFIEELGTYDPVTKPATLHIDAEKVRAWMSRGAQPSDTARSLLEQEGILPRSARVQRSRAGEAPAATASAGSAAPEGGSGGDADAAAQAAEAEPPATPDSAEETTA